MTNNQLDDGCRCVACLIVRHDSDCAVHNEPAYPKGECNCSVANDYTTKEKLLALQLLGMARQSVALYAQAQDQSAGVESVLTLAAEFASNGADYSVLKVLEYPNTKRANA